MKKKNMSQVETNENLLFYTPPKNPKQKKKNP